MKFTTAWATIAAQNSLLKFTIATLMLSTAVLAVVTAQLSLKAPLLIERGCYSRPLTTASNKRTEDEITAFINEAVRQRFDSNAERSDFLSTKENQFRTSEQRELVSRKISQNVFVHDVAVTEDKLLVDATRIIAVGKVRSGIAFPLVAQITATSRSAANPYGLLLGNITQAKEENAR